MGNPQTTKFKDVADFLDSLPSHELKMVDLLRRLVFDCIPNCKEKLAYNVPFYYRHSRMVFIWPASVPWGALDTGVALGFCKGNQMINLNTDNTKTIGRMVFNAVKDIDEKEIRQLLYEALLLDEAAHFLSKKKKQI